MARQRYIHPEFWTDPALARLTPTERLFFAGCVSHADDDGRLLGNPAYLRSVIFPYDDFTVADVAAMRNHAVQEVQGLAYYRHEDEEYLALLNWRRYQNPRYRKPSKLPSPPDGEQLRLFAEMVSESQPSPEPMGATLQPSELSTDEGLQLDGNCGLGLGRVCTGLGKGRVGATTSTVSSQDSPPPPPDATEMERKVLATLRAVADYPFAYPTDLDYLRKLAVRYPTVDLLTEAERWAVYKLDRPLTDRSSPRSQLGTWFRNAVRFEAERSQKEVPPNGRTGKPSQYRV